MVDHGVPVAHIKSPIPAPQSGAMQAPSTARPRPWSACQRPSGRCPDSRCWQASRRPESGGRVCENRTPRFGIQFRSVARIARGGIRDDLVGEQVSACPFGLIMLGRGHQEFSGSVTVMRIPASPEHALPQDQVDVLTLADTEADPQVHLGAHAPCPMAFASAAT